MMTEGTWDICPTCGGSGMIQDWFVEDCPECGGMTEIMWQHIEWDAEKYRQALNAH